MAFDTVIQLFYVFPKTPDRILAFHNYFIRLTYEELASHHKICC